MVINAHLAFLMESSLSTKGSLLEISSHSLKMLMKAKMRLSLVSVVFREKHSFSIHRRLMGYLDSQENLVIFNCNLCIKQWS